MSSMRIVVCNTMCSVVLAITGIGCVGTKVHFADVPVERLDLTRGRSITGSASGFQLFLFIPIGVNGRHAEAYERLKKAAGKDFITDIKIKESWTYAFVGTVYHTTLTAMAYPDKHALATATAQPPTGKRADLKALSAQKQMSAPLPVEPPARKAITNDDVVAMIKAGLPETTIVASIKQGPSAFDTSPQMLIDLKNQGATAGVLEAMMEPQQVPAGRSQKTATQSAAALPAQEPASRVGSVAVTPSASAAPRAGDEYIVGKTTKAEVIAKLGKPTGRGVKADGSETLRYASERWTGKAFNPFYFGSDNVRKKVAVFEFDQSGVLKEFSVSEEKSLL